MPVPTKKRSPSADPHVLVPIACRLPVGLLRDIDELLAKLNAKRVLPLSRTDVIHLLLDRWLKEGTDPQDSR